MDDLFPDDKARLVKHRGSKHALVEPADPGAEVLRLAEALPPLLHLGTSSWSFPGWRGLVWQGQHTAPHLSRHGLAAYSRHPLLRCVSLDRSFYRPLTAVEYAAHAGQVPDDFRFIVKAPSLVCDALIRGSDGRALQDNPAFLDPDLAAQEFVLPALEGLGHKVGALVFQLSPVPSSWLARFDQLLDRLRAMLEALPDVESTVPGAVVAVEVRNPEFLTRAFAQLLKSSRATYCVGLHARMPPIEEQLPLLRALWPSPLVCRWSLNRKHGAFGYEEAKGLYEPFDRIHDPDPGTRRTLAKVMAATLAHQLPVYVSINNKAEGCAPLSVLELAGAVAAHAAKGLCQSSVSQHEMFHK